VTTIPQFLAYGEFTMEFDANNTAPIRPGEELPIEALTNYLQKQLPGVEGAVTVEQFPHGHSNLTYLVRVGAKEFVLRRPPFGNQVASAHDMGREFRILSRLNTVYPAAPRPELFCDDVSVVGSPFYLMERRNGLILRKKLPAGLTINSDLARRMSTALIDNLAALHAIDYQSAGLAELGKPEGYVQRQVTGWTKRYVQAQTSTISSMDRVTGWLNENMPMEQGATVIHNDYKYDNVMLAADDLTRIVAVLDWEMATIGDPLMDLGTSLGYWVEATDPVPLQQAAFGPTALPGSLTRKEIVERYQEQTGNAVDNPLFYYCFGLFKLAVIVQQIYARYARGNTTDPRFAHLDQLVVVLGEQSDRTIDSGRL
jgi:aminoglycoside phosphotransferase (APT) family kinase protein